MMGRFSKVTQESGGCCRVKLTSIRVRSVTQICGSSSGGDASVAGEDQEKILRWFVKFPPTSDGALFKLTRLEMMAD